MTEGCTSMMNVEKNAGQKIDFLDILEQLIESLKDFFDFEFTLKEIVIFFICFRILVLPFVDRFVYNSFKFCCRRLCFTQKVRQLVGNLLNYIRLKFYGFNSNFSFQSLYRFLINNNQINESSQLNVNFDAVIDNNNRQSSQTTF